MREFAIILGAALDSAILGGAFGSIIADMSPELIRCIASPQEVASPQGFGRALGAVSGLILGAATMIFVLALNAFRSRAKN
jgi:hypothetical protein